MHEATPTASTLREAATRARVGARLPTLVALLLVAGDAVAEESASRLPEVIVHLPVLPGMAVAVEDVPGEAHTVDATDLAEDPSGNVAQTLSSRFAGVGLEDASGDALQPDLVFRGFTASPTLGTPQGLAVYQNGVRLNEAFGEVVNWDLVPTFALSRVDVVGANPVYGANALGGAVVLSTKTGMAAPGLGIEAGAGSYGERAATLEYGMARGPWALYAGTRIFDDQGFRRFSGNRLRQLFADLRYAADGASLDFSVTGADNVLRGPGATPVQELALDRRLIFTGPQQVTNRYAMTSLAAEYRLSPTATLSGVAYYRGLDEGVLNGNTTSYIACAVADGPAQLCQPDGATPLTTLDGGAVPDLSEGGTRPIGENDIESIHSITRGITLQLADQFTGLGTRHTLTAGASFDAADVDFGADVYLAVMDANLRVQEPGIAIREPEGTDFRATPVRLSVRNRVTAWHATDAIELTPRLTATASARYARNEIDLTDRQGTALTGMSRYERLNAALGATYRIEQGPTIFVDYAETTRAPSASEIECSDPARPCLLPSSLAGDPPTLRQVVARTWDIGIRQTTGAAGIRGLGYSVSAFRANLRDDIYGVATSAGAGYYTNIGATRREGLTAEVNYRSERWSGFLSAGTVNATFGESFALPSPQNPFADANGIIHVRPGDRLPGIPRARLASGVDWKFSDRVSVGATLTATDRAYLHGDESNQTAPLPRWARLDLRSTIRLSERAELTCAIHNALDAHYTNYGLYADPTGVGAPGIPTDPAAVNPRFENPAPPLTVRVGIRLRF